MSETEKEEKVLLSEQEVWSVLDFARSMGDIYNLGTYSTIDLLNSRLQDINLNPLKPTEELLAGAMQDPKSNEKSLREFSQSFELQSMVYKRLISYLSNMLAFDFTYTSDAKAKDYSTPKYKKDVAAIDEFFDNFDYKYEFQIVLREMLRNDAYFGCVRELESKTVLQELPPDYCKIIGRWESGFVFAFNMYWFSNAGVDINQYPDFFKKEYFKLYDGNPVFKTNSQTGAKYFRSEEWVEVPTDLGVCFKLSPELATRLPYFTPLFNDLVLQETMRELQKNMNMAAASKIIVGEVPLLNRDTKATVRDSIAVSPELLGKFMALVKSAVSDAIKVASAPLQEIEGISFDTDNDMYDKYLRTALASSGINTNLIFSSNVKPNAIETQLSLNVDEQMMCSLYPQFDTFINVQVAKKTKTFKFRFRFEGTEFTVNRDKRLENAFKMFDKGIILPQKIAAASGMRPSELIRQMEESDGLGFMELLRPPANETAKQLNEINGGTPAEIAERSKQVASDKPPGETVKQGRPRKSTTEISEEGMKTQETGANIARGGDV